MAGSSSHPHDHEHGAAPITQSEALAVEDRHYFDHIYLAAGHDRNARRTMWVVGLTSATMLVEIAAGYLTGSMALLADGFHMATHAGALTVAALAYSYARKHARNARFTFGTGKVGDLAGFASAVLLLVASVAIAGESLSRLFNPRGVDFADATLVAVIGLAVNLVSALLLAEDSHHHHGHDHEHEREHHDHHHSTHGHGDNNLRAAYLHVLADALTSVAAITALLAGRYLGWVWLDPAVGIAGALVIARWAWGLMRDTSSILLDTAEPALMAQMRTIAAEAGTQLLDLHVWRIGPHAHAAILSICRSHGDANKVRERVHALPGVEHVTIEER